MPKGSEGSSLGLFFWVKLTVYCGIYLIDGGNR